MTLFCPSPFQTFCWRCPWTVLYFFNLILTLGKRVNFPAATVLIWLSCSGVGRCQSPLERVRVRERVRHPHSPLRPLEARYPNVQQVTTFPSAWMQKDSLPSQIWNDDETSSRRYSFNFLSWTALAGRALCFLLRVLKKAPKTKTNPVLVHL